VTKALTTLGRQLLMVHSWSMPVRMTVNLTTWSVSAEWLAYLVFPLVVLVIARLRSARAMLLCGVCYAALGAAAIYHYDHYRPVQVGLLRIAYGFPLGVLGYRLYALRPEPSRRTALAALGLLLAFGPVAAFVLKPLKISPVIVAPTVFAFVVYGLARADFQWTGRRFPRWLGQVSYCLYLVHGWIISAIVHRVSPKQVGAFGTLAGLGYLVGCALVALGCAHVLHTWVERPFQARLAGAPRH
jgi:peptidoglycan/LPS O-acetylase OafA/YrhL